MRICVLTQTLNPRTGAGVFVGNVIEGVKRVNRDFEFSVLTSEDYLRPSLHHILKNWFYIRSKIRGSQIVHAMDAYPYGIIATLANIGISKPIIITAVGSGSIKKLGNLNLKSLILRLVYRGATRITAISHYVAEEVKKVLPNISIEVINPGVDYDFYSKETGGGSLPDRYIVTQGEFKQRKGYLEMLPILAKVMSTYPELKYVIVANTSRNQSYQSEFFGLVEKLGIKDRIIIKSNLTREELREVYRNALLYFTLPIRVGDDIEGFGMAIMEAASTGTPAVVGKGSGANDAVLESQSGYLVDGKDDEKVTEKIVSIIENKELRKKLSEGASNWAKGNGLDSKARKYIDLYNKI